MLSNNLSIKVPDKLTAQNDDHPLNPANNGHQQQQQQQQQLHSMMSPSSLSTDEYSSRYSSLQDAESLKSAILDSFRMHWIQAWSIMDSKIGQEVTMDDISSIVNHLEQMISLLIEENVADVRTSASSSDLNRTEQTSASSDNSDPVVGHHHHHHHRHPNPNPNPNQNPSTLSPLLEFLAMENILERIFNWSNQSGEWKHVMYLEQLKLYELLISQLCQTDIVLTKPTFVQPLTNLLDSLSLFLVSNYSMVNFIEIEKRLVILLNTVCVAISQNTRLLNIFISCSTTTTTTKMDNSTTASRSQENFPSQTTNDIVNCDMNYDQNMDQPHGDGHHQMDRFSFPIVPLLINFIHRDGAIGQQSRDSLLLCLAMSRFEERLAYFIANKTDFCPVLATCLSGHFSSLPRVLIAQSMSTIDQQQQQQYHPQQFKHGFVGATNKEIDHFLKCLDFCNAVVQISHPIIQVQLLKYIFHGFLISVIGPALHQDVANISIQDLETLPTYSNTLDVIMTTMAYLDLFIRTISEPKLIRIFLEFLCFEIYDNNYIITTLIKRIEAKSKLSLITLIFFKTLLDLNCEDLLYELIFKYLLRGEHLRKEEKTPPPPPSSNAAAAKQSPSYESYQKNWLAISAQKLLANSVSYYLNSLCQHHQAPSAKHHHLGDDNESNSSFDSIGSSCLKCQTNYSARYLDYLNEARFNIDQCSSATKSWRNRYSEPCDLLDEIDDENIIFCTIDKMDKNLTNQNDNNNNNNNNHNSHSDQTDVEDHDHDPDDQNDDDCMETLDVNDIITRNSLMAKLSPGFKMKNCYYDERLKRIHFKIDHNPILRPQQLHHFGHGEPSEQPSPPMGLFLSVIMAKFENFFENTVLTNLHLTGLLTRLCQFSHKLLLQFLFDETLLRKPQAPCFMHVLQKLSLEAQNYCDEIADFETIFHAAKINLQSMPIGELDCPLLASNINLRASNSSLASTNRSIDSETGFRPTQQQQQPQPNKTFGKLKNLFFRPNNIPQQLARRLSNASTVSSTSQMLEVIPGGGIRFINQTNSKNKNTMKENMDQNRFNELIYNMIILDEFLMEMSASLIEHSLRDFCYD